MYFYPYGPFKIPRYNSLITTRSIVKKRFWQEIETQIPGLPEACGCYIFSIRNTVWYIGQTNKQGFKGECFFSEKLNKYNEALSNFKKPGNPTLMLIARTTDTHRFSNPGSYRDILFLEKMLIAYGLKRNPDLINIKDTKLLRQMAVPGVINTWQGAGKAKSIQFLKLSLGIR